MKKKKRGGGFLSFSRNIWYYGAAAGVVVALAVALLNQDGDKTGNGVLADKNKVVQPIETTKTTGTKEQPRFAVTKPQDGSSAVGLQNKTNNIKDITPKTIESTPQLAENKTKINSTEFVNPILDNTIDSHGETNAVAGLTAEPATRTEIGNIETIDAKTFSNEVVFVLNGTPQTSDYVPQIDADSNTEFEQIRRLAMEREENSKSFLARLSEEYKHFKYGEKVDLENLKLNPKDILARADEEFLKEERNDIKSVFQRKIGKFLK